MDPSQLTVENVVKNRHLLTGADYQRFLKKAQEYKAQPAKLQDAISKAKIDNDEFELMLATNRPNEFKDTKYRNSPKFFQERYAYQQAVRSAMIQKGVTQLPAEERMKIAETVLNTSSGSSTWWNPSTWGNKEASRGEVMARNFSSQSTGRNDLALSLEEWTPANPVTGEVVDNAKQVRTRLIDFLRTKTGKEPSTAQVASLWARCFDANGNRIRIKELE